MANRGLSVDEIKNRCQQVGLEYISHYIEKQATMVIAKCQ